MKDSGEPISMAMSRRKQLKPRALKRELDEESAESGVGAESREMMETETSITNDESPAQADDVLPPSVVALETPGHEDEAVPREVAMVAGDEEEVEGEEYRCEMCDTVFQNLTQFMDHRNYDCSAVLEQLPSWVYPSSLVSSRASSLTPSDAVGMDGALGSPESPSLARLSPSQVPGVDGVDETHPYACPQCNKAFSKSAYLSKHLLMHPDLQPYKCDHCPRVFKHKHSRDRHLRIHQHGPNFRCPQCQACFSRSDSLRVHLRVHESSKPFLCPMCSLELPSLHALTSHMVLHRGNKVKSESDGSLQMSPLELGGSTIDLLNGRNLRESMGNALICPHCRDRCLSLEEMEAHLQSHNEEMAMAQDKTVLSCPYCADIFVEEEVLELHIEHSHTIESINKCPICSMCFLDCEDLTLHLKSHETVAMLQNAKLSAKRKSHGPGEQSISGSSETEEQENSSLDCPYCRRKGFTTLGMLNVHIRTMHTGIADHLFSCHICQVGFASSGKLIEHMQREHPGLIQQDDLQIKFPCDYCTLEFNSSDVLKQHKEKIHKITDLIPKPVDVVYCSQCTMGFPHIYALAEHMHNVHGYNNNNRSSPSLTPSKMMSPGVTSSEKSKSPYRDSKNYSPGNMQEESYLCDHCNSTFHNLSSYQIHIKNHVDVSKYACTECQAEFTSEEQLENHMFVHYLSLATQYGCTCCLKLFPKPDDLQKHLIDIHAHHLYRCSLCKEVFDSKVNIQVHFAIKHSNECKLYKCSSCSSVFRSEMEWQLHVKIYHLGISKPYRCFFCKESFTSQNDLQTHIATHKKQFSCPSCDEAFHVEYLLDKHMQTHHCPDGIKVQGIKIKTEPPECLQFSSPASTSSLSKSSGSIKSQSPSREKQRPLLPAASPNHLLPPQPKKGDLIYKCEICDVKFSDEGTLQKHRVHDHSMSPEMQLVIEKSQQAKATQQSLLNAACLKNGTGSEKFSQLCVYCNQTFKTKGELEKHMKTHVTPSNQKCNICDEIFPSASILAEHKLTHCKVVKGNVCVVCKVAIKTEEQFYTHSQQHGFQGTNMQCVVCRQTLASMLELQMHARHHFQNPANFYTCCVCVKSFNSKENLISKLNTSGRTYYVCKPCYHGDLPLDHTCTQCNIKFENKVQLEMHLLQHQKTFQCIKCQQSFATEYEIQLHVATHVMQEGNVHECKICSQIFESPAKLQGHLIEHTFEKTEMKCYVCGLIFTQASSIQTHVLEHGVGARQYSCPQCPQKFFFSAELQNHMFVHSPVTSMTLPTIPATTMPGSPEYQCQDCPKTFHTLSQLKSHHKLHKEALLQCSLCMEPFSSMVELQQHFFLAHSGLDFDKPMFSGMPSPRSPNTSPKKPVHCLECNKEFPSINSLQGHMRVHSSTYKNKNNHGAASNGSAPTDLSVNGKYPCSECGKELSSSKNLAFHMRVHKGDKPYECPVCHKRFSRKENRRSHMKTHTGVKPYTCQVCGRNFSRRCHVKEHIKVHFTQPSTHTCEVCGDLFSGLRNLRRHMTSVHGKQPDYVCKLCSERYPSASSLRGHILDSHHLGEDLLDAMSITSEDTANDEDFDMEDLSDSVSLGSDGLFQNGQENMDPAESTQRDYDLIPKLETQVTVVTNPPEQMVVT